MVMMMKAARNNPIPYGDWAALARHFEPGNVIFSDYWHTYDLILRFHHPGANKAWLVDVQHCDRDGNLIPGERRRTHCTWPDPKDYVVANVAGDCPESPLTMNLR
jgi:hypothetical protein